MAFTLSMQKSNRKGGKAKISITLNEHLSPEKSENIPAFMISFLMKKRNLN